MTEFPTPKYEIGDQVYAGMPGNPHNGKVAMVTGYDPTSGLHTVQFRDGEVMRLMPMSLQPKPATTDTAKKKAEPPVESVDLSDFRVKVPDTGKVTEEREARAYNAGIQLGREQLVIENGGDVRNARRWAGGLRDRREESPNEGDHAEPGEEPTPDLSLELRRAELLMTLALEANNQELTDAAWREAAEILGVWIEPSAEEQPKPAGLRQTIARAEVARALSEVYAAEGTPLAGMMAVRAVADKLGITVYEVMS